jgi:Fe-S-cluster containining protein
MSQVPYAGPEMIREDGSCVHLLEDSTCSIYESRPWFCRVDECIDTLGMPKDYGYRKTADVCNALMMHDGIEGKFVQLTVHGAPSASDQPKT